MQFRDARIIKLVDAEEVNAAAVRRVPVDGGHVELFGMGAPKQCKCCVIRWSVEIDHRGHARLARIVSAGVVDKKASGRLAYESELRRIDMVFGGMRFHPLDSGVDVVDSIVEMGFGSEPVVN